MATEAWHTASSVTEATTQTLSRDGKEDVFPPKEGVYGRLFREGYRFDFFQAVQLLEAYFTDAPAPGVTAEARRERILFRPDNALTFPSADVRRIVALEGSARQARLEVTFMGLYGVASPLPVYFYEDLALDVAEVEPLRDFLDIFNHRLYAYFYRAWKKYRPSLRQDGVGSAQRYLSIAGLGTEAALEDISKRRRMRFAAFASWLSPRVRNAEGLQKFLAAMLEDIPLRIQENVMRRVPLAQRSRMGAGEGGFRLGTSAVVGQSVVDISGKFRILIGPIAFKEYQSFLPGRVRALLLHTLVRMYVPDYLDYDVEIQLDTSQIPSASLGNRMVRLGRTIWLGRPKEAVTTHCVEYEE